MSKIKNMRRVGGWTTRRGEDEGFILYISNPNEARDNVEAWIDKQTATRLAHSVLEAQIRFWDILWNPDKIRDKVKDLAQRVGMDVSEPYRRGCPFCHYVADSEDDMREHLKEHEIHIVIVENEAAE